jgi:hypothetical protein
MIANFQGKNSLDSLKYFAYHEAKRASEQKNFEKAHHERRQPRARLLLCIICLHTKIPALKIASKSEVYAYIVAATQSFPSPYSSGDDVS